MDEQKPFIMCLHKGKTPEDYPQTKW